MCMLLNKLVKRDSTQPAYSSDHANFHNLYLSMLRATHFSLLAQNWANSRSHWAHSLARTAQIVGLTRKRAIYCASQYYSLSSPIFPTSTASIFGRINPCLRAQEIALLLLLAPNFSVMRSRWKMTVRRAILNIWAYYWLASPPQPTDRPLTPASLKERRL